MELGTRCWWRDTWAPPTRLGTTGLDHLQNAPNSLNCSFWLWGEVICLYKLGLAESKANSDFHFLFLFVFQQQHQINMPSQVVDVRNCSRAENMHICFLFTRIILSNRHSWLKGASRVFSHKPFNAGWHDEWFSFLVMVGLATQQMPSIRKCHHWWSALHLFFFLSLQSLHSLRLLSLHAAFLLLIDFHALSENMLFVSQ